MVVRGEMDAKAELSTDAGILLGELGVRVGSAEEVFVERQRIATERFGGRNGQRRRTKHFGS